MSGTDCPNCDGSTVVDGDPCAVCHGTGRDPKLCEKCTEPGVGFSEDGEFLCEDCIFEKHSEQDDEAGEEFD